MLDELHQWIAEGESSHMEFKLQINNPVRIAQTISAIANNKGGKIIVGIMDDGLIVGLVDVAAQQQKIQEAANVHCHPPVPVVITSHEENYLVILVVSIPESTKKPHMVIKADGNQQIYIRVKDKTMPASKNIVKQLENEAFSTPSNRSLDSKEKAIVEYLHTHDHITIPQLMHHLNLSRRRARRILVKLTKERRLRVFESDKEDLYTLY